MKLFNWGRKKETPPPPPRKRQRISPTLTFGKRIFDAGKTDRLSMEWGNDPLTADDVISKNWGPLVARSQEQIANNDYAKHYVRLAMQNIVGQRGIVLQGRSKDRKGTLDAQANAAIERAWKDWSKKNNCDVTGKKSMREVANLAVRSAIATGEFFLRKVYGQDGGRYGFALQFIPSQRCPVDMVIDRLNGGTNFVRFGIEFTQYGRPVAYYFRTLMSDADRYMYNGNPYVRVVAEDIIHGFREEIPGQRRGLPWLATSLFRMRQLKGMEESALVNARIGANKMAFVKFDNESDAPEYDEDDPPVIDSEPGEINWLPKGASLDKWDPQYPNGEYAIFTKQQLRSIAAGLGVAYNNLAQDLEGVNFSSIRQGTLDERETWRDLQEWMIEDLMQPVFDAWLPRALLAGLITTDNGKSLNPVQLSKYSEVLWQPRRWAWIDPVSDVKASVAAKNAMLKSPSELIRDGGQDPEEVWTQTAQDISTQLEYLRKAGLSEKAAENLVMSGYAIDPKLMVEPNEAENSNSGNAGGNSGQ